MNNHIFSTLCPIMHLALRSTPNKWLSQKLWCKKTRHAAFSLYVSTMHMLCTLCGHIYRCYANFVSRIQSFQTESARLGRFPHTEFSTAGHGNSLSWPKESCLVWEWLLCEWNTIDNKSRKFHEILQKCDAPLKSLWNQNIFLGLKD